MQGKHQMAAPRQQFDRLVRAARNAGLEHGTEVLVDLENVKIDPVEIHTSRELVLASMRFCDCCMIYNNLLGGKPDGQEMPTDVFIDKNIRVPHVSADKRPRTYRVENLIFSSNGRNELRATKQTRFVRTDREIRKEEPAVELALQD